MHNCKCNVAVKDEIDFLRSVLIHIFEVQSNIEKIIQVLKEESCSHDLSKLDDLEFDKFSSNIRRFKKIDYGTKEYEQIEEESKEAILHHYKNNRHHTSHFKEGINEMTLMDLCIMVADWKSSEKRSPTKKLKDTLKYSYKKYYIDEQLQKIIENTLKYLNWI